MTSRSEEVGAQRQRGIEVHQLDAAAREWLAQLPSILQPEQTAREYPRIVNQLAKLWPSKQPCNAYFEELLLDNRGSRKGFPSKVATELASLKSYYESAVFPSPQTVWDELAERMRSM